MNCGQFRQFYSDFTDGQLDEAEEVAFHVHMAECVDCRRFDAALEQGRLALRRLDQVALGGDFQSRLNDRILREGPTAPDPVLRQWSGMAGAVLVVAVVSVVGWNARRVFGPDAGSPLRSTGREASAVLSGDSAVRALGRIPVLKLPHDSLAALSHSARPVEISTDEMIP